MYNTHCYYKHNIYYLSGWIAVDDGFSIYPLNSNTLYIITESLSGSDEVDFSLFPDSGVARITAIQWRFSDGGYSIPRCTPLDFSLKFPVTPPTGVKKTWEVTLTTKDIRIKCNTLEVLHLNFDSTYRDDCSTKVKGKKATRVAFSTTAKATKMFRTEPVGT